MEETPQISEGKKAFVYSVQGKFAFIILFFILFLISIVITTFFVVDSQSDDAETIDIAVRQQILIMNIDREVDALTAALEQHALSEEIRERLNSHITLFERSLSALRDGGKTIGSNHTETNLPASSNAARDKLLEVTELWSSKQKALSTILESSPDALSDAFYRAREQLQWDPLSKASNQASILLKEDSKSKVDILKGILIASIILALIAATAAWYLTNWFVARPLQQLAQTIRKVRHSSDFSQQIPVEWADEVGDTISCFNQLMMSLQQTIGNVGNVMKGAAHGDFGRRVDAELKGDLQHLKDSINECMSEIQHTLQGACEVMEAVSDGNFSQRIESQLRGELALFGNHINRAVDSLEQTTDALTKMMQAMVQGNFHHRMSTEVGGEMRQEVDRAMHAMEQAIGEISTVMTAVAEGDLERQIEGEYPGQLGTLTTSINHSLTNQQHTVSEVRTAAEQVAGSAREISINSTDIARRMEQQASSLQQTASTMEQMTGSVKQNADHANQTHQLVKAARSDASSGGEVARKTILAMEEISTSSQKIGDIIDVIDSIAFQTNLLALNAAVEAARAGEQGRGFAVVAGEVRNLAQRSTTAAKEIKDLIEDSSNKVNEGQRLVQQSGEALENIVHAIEKVDDVIAEIADANQEQYNSIEQTNKAVTQLDQITQKNATQVEDAASTSQSLDEQAQSLIRLMAFFKHK